MREVRCEVGSKDRGVLIWTPCLLEEKKKAQFQIDHHHLPVIFWQLVHLKKNPILHPCPFCPRTFKYQPLVAISFIWSHSLICINVCLLLKVTPSFPQNFRTRFFPFNTFSNLIFFFCNFLAYLKPLPQVSSQFPSLWHGLKTWMEGNSIRPIGRFTLIQPLQEWSKG